MKINRKLLRKIINEEIQNILSEEPATGSARLLPAVCKCVPILRRGGGAETDAVARQCARTVHNWARRKLSELARAGQAVPSDEVETWKRSAPAIACREAAKVAKAKPAPPAAGA